MKIRRKKSGKSETKSSSGKNGTGFITFVRTHLPLLIVGTIVILLLFFNEETSLSLNMKYDNEIRELKAKIKSNTDSAEYYRAKREDILNGTQDLEAIAREQYHMQLPTEDVYVIRDK